MWSVTGETRNEVHDRCDAGAAVFWSPPREAHLVAPRDQSGVAIVFRLPVEVETPTPEDALEKLVVERRGRRRMYRPVLWK